MACSELGSRLPYTARASGHTASRPDRADPMIRLALARPGWAGALMTAVPQVACAATAIALGLVHDDGWRRPLFVVAAAWLCCVPTAAVHRPGPRLLVLALLTAAFACVLRPYELAYVALSAGTAALAAHCLQRFRAALDVCRSLARSERRRAAQEHRRLQRDLHDLLGYSLSAIVVQAELIDLRLAGEYSPRRAEVTELLSLSRRALAEVRSLAAGPQQLSLPGELASVQRVLKTAGMDVNVVDDAPPLHDREVEAALAAVLREGTTNILRHSHARSCRITLGRSGRRTVLVLSNDGFEPAHGEEAGTGLESLSARVAAVGGTLTWSHDKDWFRLRAACPAAPAKAVSPARACPADQVGGKQRRLIAPGLRHDRPARP